MTLSASRHTLQRCAYVLSRGPDWACTLAGEVLVPGAPPLVLCALKSSLSDMLLSLLTACLLHCFALWQLALRICL